MKKIVKTRFDSLFSPMLQRAFSVLWKKYFDKLEFGLYPKEYNYKVHGIYVPYRYYGKREYLEYSCFCRFDLFTCEA